MSLLRTYLSPISLFSELSTGLHAPECELICSSVKYKYSEQTKQFQGWEVKNQRDGCVLVIEDVEGRWSRFQLGVLRGKGSRDLINSLGFMLQACGSRRLTNPVGFDTMYMLHSECLEDIERELKQTYSIKLNRNNSPLGKIFLNGILERDNTSAVLQAGPTLEKNKIFLVLSFDYSWSKQKTLRRKALVDDICHYITQKLVL